MGIQILPPDVNESGSLFTATPAGIRFAMAGIKGVGRGIVEAILEERKKNGLFKSLFEFCKRIDLRKVGKKSIENLIEAGCFDFTKWSRAELLESVDPMFEHSLKKQKEEAKGIMDFFSHLEDEENHPYNQPPKVTKQQGKEEILAKEKEFLGFYLTGHPMDRYRTLIQELGCLPLSQLSEASSGTIAKIAFIVESVKIKVSQKTQKKFAILFISDGAERLELPIWSDLFEECQQKLEENKLLIGMVAIDHEMGDLKLRLRALEDLKALSEQELSSVKEHFTTMEEKVQQELRRKKKYQNEKVSESNSSKKLQLLLLTDQLRLSDIVKLKKLLERYPGDVPIAIDFHANQKKLGTVEVESKWGIGWCSELEESLSAVPFVDQFSYSE